MDELSHVHAACVVRMRAVAVILCFFREVLRQEAEESHHHLGAAAVPPQREKPVSEPGRIRAREVVPRVHKQVEDPIRVLLHPQADVEVVLGELRPLAVSPYPKGWRAMDVVVGGLDHVHELVADEVVVASTFHPGVDPDVAGVQEVVKSGEVVSGMTAEEAALMMDRVSTGVGAEGTISLLVVSPRPRGEIENPIRLRPVHVVIEVNGGVIVETDKTDEQIMLEPVLLYGLGRRGQSSSCAEHFELVDAGCRGSVLCWRGDVQTDETRLSTGDGVVGDVLSVASDIDRGDEIRPVHAGLDIEVASVQGGALASRARVAQSKTGDIETPRQVDLQKSRGGAGTPLIAIASGDAPIKRLRRAFVCVARRAAGRRFAARHIDAAAAARGDVGKYLEFVNTRRYVIGLLGLSDIQSHEARRRCGNRMSGDALGVVGHVHYGSEIGPIGADLDVESAGVKVGALASRARMPHYKARNVEVLSEVHLQELGACL